MAEIVGPASAVEEVTPNTEEWWLKDPLDPDRNSLVHVAAFEAKETEKVSVFAPLGRDKPVVLSDGMLGVDGSCSFEVMDQTEWDALMLMLRDTRTLLLQSPWGDNYYCRFTSDRGWSMMNTGANFPVREVKVSFNEVEVP